MFAPKEIVLLDTNVILEAHRTGCWNTLADYFDFRTVEKVIEETQTGFQNRDSELTIDEGSLRASFAFIADVDDSERVAFNIAHNHPSLDAGERDLLVYADLIETNPWLLNSPDNAAVRFALERGWRDQLVSLEAMSGHLSVRLKMGLRDNYTESWLSAKRTHFLLDM